MPSIVQHLGVLLVGASILAAPASPVLAQQGGSEVRGGQSCPAAYHDALEGVRAGVFKTVARPAAAALSAGDPSLPGALLFVPPSLRRAPAEQAALREANALAKRRGAAGGLAGSNERWVAERVRADLADYLDQSPSPYLCENVDFFLGTMRRQLGTIGGIDPSTHQANLATQREAAAAAVSRAFAAMRPVPLPRFAPEARPIPAAIAGLREAQGADREAVLDAVVTHGIRRPAAFEAPITPGAAAVQPMPAGLAGPPAPMRVRMAAGPVIDPDLPPLALAGKAPPAIDSEADRLATIDRLVEAATVGGFLRAAPLLSAAAGTAATPSRPVLARLAEVKARLAGGAAVPDAQARLQLVAALSAIEALDYLALAPDAPVDPTLKGLEDTMQAIETAHGKALKASGETGR
ncbi:hypothetical protein [Antarcticirhabdus aurantiaca]|uniref:Uncharacterized protein n=1 Tax=Antarcticirhabdus aurantiaca TaxID=2606717 RepID=A0ACD4NQ28_9HYPH|nr:hypothetical protein [Antarcticirhabdus aurantiaca]WAJ28849.1 hypothetical protein OXU80_00940 [Jeongeuplla avenae]